MENIWEIARKMEIEGEEFYRKLAHEAPTDELSGLFLFLADQEKEHCAFFELMKKGLSPTHKEVMDAFVVAHKVFKKIAPDFASSASDKISSAEAMYKKAIALETKAVEYYVSLLNEAKTEDQKKALSIIIREEQKHEKLMEMVIEYMVKPTEWPEDFTFDPPQIS